ncbi:MAG TPA: DUF5683 domain-containing protein [Parasegetibacter sp.]
MRYILLLYFSLLCVPALASDTIPPIDSDSIPVIVSDSVKTRRTIIPRVATIRSAIIPGWGQIYNRKYWKLPLVYGALGTTAWVFRENVVTYRDLRDAYRNRLDGDPSNDHLINPDFVVLSNESIRYNRDQFRRNVDYSVLVFIVFWGLNIVDATVDAHLSSFDVSQDISLKIKPGYSPMANTTGISLVMDLGKVNNSSSRR